VLLADKPLPFEPGTDQHYSNPGHLVLGATVALVSGMPYAEYVERHVFESAGTTGAVFAARDRVAYDVAVGYTRQGVEPPSGDPGGTCSLRGVRLEWPPLSFSGAVGVWGGVACRSERQLLVALR